jgi:CheY-like chemotaxis protein
LAEAHRVILELALPARPVTVSADPLLARQVLIGVLSHATQHALPGIVSLTLAREREGATVAVSYDVAPESMGAPSVGVVLAQLADRLRWPIAQRDLPAARRVVTLHVAAPGPTVLVIDDNEGLVSLLERYLTDQACRVVAASDGQEGLRLAAEMVPDAIVLDVMMPEMDGWQVLQRLQMDPDTATVPVIVCTVIDDRELALSLGASDYLPKPVTRDAVLETLARLGVV